MKVGELREKLRKLKEEEIIKLAVEFYKLIPKAKKEDYNVDSLINNPAAPKSRAKSKSPLKLVEIEVQVNEFIKHAKERYYFMANRVIPKKERSTWRFKVKKWYKELINIKRSDADLEKQAVLLGNLYKLMCESYRYEYFSAYDAFESIQIDQTDFYKSVINLLHASKGKADTVKQCIHLIVNNALSRHTLYESLMKELIKTYDAPDLKYKAIEIIKELISKNNFIPQKNAKDHHWLFKGNVFEKKEKHNDLTKWVYLIYSSLFELDNSIQFFEDNYYELNKEIKLYILVRMLFAERQKDKIVEVIERAIAKRIKPRKNLMDLVNGIKLNNELPKYML